MKNKSGFTLIELLVIIGIIGILAVVVLVNLNSSRRKAQAARIVENFRELQNAWAIWQADTTEIFPEEDSFGLSNSEAPCHDDPVISDTDLYTDVLGLPGWSGPYFAEAVRDTWGRQYSYDNDDDLWTTDPADKWNGVNILLQWCDPVEGARYIDLAPEVDKIFDQSDGEDAGRFRWDNNSNNGSYGILIVPHSSQ